MCAKPAGVVHIVLHLTSSQELSLPATTPETSSGVSSNLVNDLVLPLHHKAKSTEAIRNRPTKLSQVQQQQVMTVKSASPEHD